MIASSPDLDGQSDEVLGLAVALRRLLKPGLPVLPELAEDVLLDLPGVRARSSDPADRLSRVAALDGLLRWLLARLNDSSAEAARALFGLPPAAAGTTLTERREIAAAASGHEVHHFRKRLEPKILSLLGWALRKDSNDYTATRALAPPLAPSSGRLIIPADAFAWEAAEHAELLSTLWSGVYALRAELIGLARSRSMRGEPAALNAAARHALWSYARLLGLAAQYRAAFGDVLLHADTGLSPDGLAELAGWTPPLQPEHRRVLAELGEEDPEAFIQRVAGERFADGWCEALTGYAPTTTRTPGSST